MALKRPDCLSWNSDQNFQMQISVLTREAQFALCRELPRSVGTWDLVTRVAVWEADEHRGGKVISGGPLRACRTCKMIHGDTSAWESVGG